MTEQTCSNCEMKKNEWSWNQGEGYRKDGNTYCLKVVQRILSAPASIQWVRNMPQYKVSKASWTVDAFVRS